MTPPDTAATESWDDVPIRDCYTKVQGQRCGPEHGWASWLGTFYRCPGTRSPGAAVAALDGDERGVAAPTSPPPPVATAAGYRVGDLGEQTNAEWVARLDVPMLLGAVKNLIGAVQNITGSEPNGYAAASIVQQMGEFLTLHAKPAPSREAVQHARMLADIDAADEDD